MPCKKNWLVCIIIFLSFISGCEIINPPDPIPAYIQVDTITVSGNSSQQSLIHEVQDVWIYVNGSVVGTYQVPFSVPVLPAGEHSVTLEPGIKESGLASFREVYPFLKSYKFDTLLSELDTIVINPVFEYDENAIIPLNEDFESLGVEFENTESSDTSLMIVSNSNTINGKSGYIALDEDHTQFDCRTTDIYDLPRTSKVYVEFEYYSEKANITAGVFAQEISGGNLVDVRYSVITLFPDTKWHKVYVNLTDVIAARPSAYGFRLYFSANKPENTSGELVEIYIDNIKILHH